MLCSSDNPSTFNSSTTDSGALEIQVGIWDNIGISGREIYRHIWWHVLRQTNYIFQYCKITVNIFRPYYNSSLLLTFILLTPENITEVTGWYAFSDQFQKNNDHHNIAIVLIQITSPLGPEVKNLGNTVFLLPPL